MTPAEHYREAERLLAMTADGLGSNDPRDPIIVATAQVHATLATCGYRSSMGGDSPEAVSDV